MVRTAQPTEKTVHTSINGITLAFNDQGTSLPLVFLHAFPLNRTMWADQEHALSSQFRVITIDLRGHGESDAPLWRYSLDQAADDVRALLDCLSIQQAVFVGLSMGGYILFAFYRKYAERVKGLVLADTRAQADTDEGKQARFELAQIAYKQGASAVADIMIPKLLSPATIRTRPELVRRVRTMIESNQISGIVGDLTRIPQLNVDHGEAPEAHGANGRARTGVSVRFGGGCEVSSASLSSQSNC
ncbi:MAG: alpha/beta fold hydrolase, partial [Nitrospira sp. LK70]|nr:alpha/beta fold hydrolase [Nitrospira sp. LK70]